MWLSFLHLILLLLLLISNYNINTRSSSQIAPCCRLLTNQTRCFTSVTRCLPYLLQFLTKKQVSQPIAYYKFTITVRQAINEDLESFGLDPIDDIGEKLRAELLEEVIERVDSGEWWF